MARFKFLHENLWDSGTLTYSSQDSNFPASNTQHPWLSKTWRSTTVITEQWLKIYLGTSPAAVSVFIIKNHNLTSGATLRLQGNNIDDWTSVSYDATIAVNEDIIVHFLPSALSLSYWKISIFDNENSDGFLEIGRIYLGSYTSLSKNFTEGWRDYIDDKSLVAHSEGHQLSAIEREKIRHLFYLFRSITDSDKQTLEDIFFSKGLSKDLFICEDSDYANEKAFYVRFASPLDHENIMTGYWDVELEFEELK